MGIRDLEKALDRLENALCAASVPDWLKREVQAFSTHVAAELVAQLERQDGERAEIIRLLYRAGGN